MSNDKVRCPDCKGTGVYTPPEGGEGWECQLCDGECVLDRKEAEEHVQKWNNYKEMMSSVKGLNIEP